MVKDVNVDATYKRGLLKEGKKRDKVGAFVDGKKRPGKIFTAMSFCEAGEGEHRTVMSNSSFSWRRELLSEVRVFVGFDSAIFVWLVGKFRKMSEIFLIGLACN